MSFFVKKRIFQMSFVVMTVIGDRLVKRKRTEEQKEQKEANRRVTLHRLKHGLSCL